MDGSLSSLLCGKTAKLLENRGKKLITWKQGSFLGFGGDQSQRYHECVYSLEDNDGGKLPVFIQERISPPEVMELDSKLQVIFSSNMDCAKIGVISGFSHFKKYFQKHCYLSKHLHTQLLIGCQQVTSNLWKSWWNVLLKWYAIWQVPFSVKHAHWLINEIYNSNSTSKLNG